MGLSASQARFLQLTARRGNIEYQAQQINQKRLQLATNLEMASNEYQDKVSNRKLVFRYNTGSGMNSVDVTYQNYKNIMNQQQEGLETTQKQFYLVSSSGNKIIVANTKERDEMIINSGKPNNKGEYTQILDQDDFMIVDNLDDVDAFQKAIQEGNYYFATMDYEFDNAGNAKVNFTTDGWETLGNGAITEDYDKDDDKIAEAKFKSQEDTIHTQDKRLELKLDQLESERNAIQTEIDSVSKVIDDNIEQSFKTFNS